MSIIEEAVGLRIELDHELPNPGRHLGAGLVATRVAEVRAEGATADVSRAPLSTGATTTIQRPAATVADEAAVEPTAHRSASANVRDATAAAGLVSRAAAAVQRATTAVWNGAAVLPLSSAGCRSTNATAPVAGEVRRATWRARGAIGGAAERWRVPRLTGVPRAASGGACRRVAAVGAGAR